MRAAMSMRRFVLVAGIIFVLAGQASGATPPDLALCVNVENPLRRAGAYCVLHLQILGGSPFDNYVIQNGDALEYDVLIGPTTPPTGGGVDLQFAELDSLSVLMARQVPELADAAEQSWLSAIGHWQHVRVPLSIAVGRKINRCCVRILGDNAGLYQVVLDNILIRRSGQPPLVFYDSQPNVAVGLQVASGFRMPHAVVFDKNLLPTDATLPAVMQRLYETSLELSRLTAVSAGLKLLQEDFVATHDPTNFPAVAAQIAHFGGRRFLWELQPQKFAAQMDSLLAATEPLRPYAKQYTVHAVAYAPLDFLSLWNWPETVQAARDTFQQMLVFMDEFPQFTFTYTSPSLFETLEHEDPALFAQIQRRVREGRWEMVGARWCEADPNLISEESNARHFLQAQRYNLEKFGTQTTTCYEPDIFGHLPTMPQLLRQCGIRYFVTEHLPLDRSLFWWGGLDGSRVLVCHPRHYSETLDEHLLDICLPLNQRLAGYKDSLIVYGVGNHGGGPSHDQIENAIRLDKLPVFPSVKFSRLQDFMETISREASANSNTRRAGRHPPGLPRRLHHARRTQTAESRLREHLDHRRVLRRHLANPRPSDPDQPLR